MRLTKNYHSSRQGFGLVRAALGEMRYAFLRGEP